MRVALSLISWSWKDTARRRVSVNQEEGPSQNSPMLAPWSGLPSIQNWRKKLVIQASNLYFYWSNPGLPRWHSLVVKNLSANAGDIRDAGLIPGLGRSPGGGNGYPLQYSCLQNSTDRGTQQATVHGITESDTNEATCTHTHTHTHTHLAT